LRAPLDGVVALKNTLAAAGAAPLPFKAGDRAWPGAGIAELPDPSKLKVLARIEEAERGQLKLGQSAMIRVDAVPDGSFGGHIDTISPTASLDFNAGWPVPRNFSVEVVLANSDVRLAPGMGAGRSRGGGSHCRWDCDSFFRTLPQGGRTVAYVRHGSKFEETPIEVSRRSGAEVLVAKGIAAGRAACS